MTQRIDGQDIADTASPRSVMAKSSFASRLGDVS
jgi:hypothetical protein